jgi:VanZ family protein
MTAVIMLESTVWLGADHTSGPLRSVYEALFGHVSDARWEVIHHYIRKTGHFVGYGLVGLSWLSAWRKSRPSRSFLSSAALAMIVTAIIASLDEFHQSFLPNRTSSPWDVLLDCTGALTLLLLAGAISLTQRTHPVEKAA